MPGRQHYHKLKPIRERSKEERGKFAVTMTKGHKLVYAKPKSTKKNTRKRVAGK